MTGPTRYETKIEGETFSIESDEGWLKVGPMDAVLDLLGGQTYTLEYTDRQSAVSWLDTDEDNTLTIDLRERLSEMSYTDDFVTNLENCPLDESGESGYPKRTELFADLMAEILDSKGNLGE